MSPPGVAQQRRRQPARTTGTRPERRERQTSEATARVPAYLRAQLTGAEPLVNVDVAPEAMAAAEPATPAAPATTNAPPPGAAGAAPPAAEPAASAGPPSARASAPALEQASTADTVAPSEAAWAEPVSELPTPTAPETSAPAPAQGMATAAAATPPAAEAATTTAAAEAVGAMGQAPGATAEADAAATAEAPGTAGVPGAAPAAGQGAGQTAAPAASESAEAPAAKAASGTGATAETAAGAPPPAAPGGASAPTPAGAAPGAAAPGEGAAAKGEKPLEKRAKGKAEEGEAPPAGAGTEGGEAAPAAPPAPKSPDEDPGFQAMKARAGGVARREKAHAPARAKAGAAQAAASGPANEVASEAAAKQVGKIAEQQPKPFDRSAFKKALLDKIAAIAPKNLKEADDFKSSGKAGTIKGAVTDKVAKSKEESEHAIATTTAEAPSTSGIQPKPVTPMAPNEPGPPPGGVGASQAAPKPKSPDEVSLEAGSRSLDDEMSQNDVTEEQLQQSNEPEFQQAVEAKQTAQTDAREAPQAYRQDEQAILADASAQAVGRAAAGTHSMHAGRAAALNKVTSDQQNAKGSDEQARTKVANDLQKIYTDTKQKVEKRLKRLDTDVNTAFDRGAESSRKSFEDFVKKRMDDYKDRRYSGVIGKGRWVKDKLLGLPKEVNKFYKQGRDLYIALMNKVIDKVATIVETGLTEAKKLVDTGRANIKKYVDGLPKELQKVGKDAADAIQNKFDSLEQSVNDKQGQLIDSLAQKYVDNLNKVDARIEQMKAANRGLVDKAMDAVKGVVKTIIKLKDMLLGVLARAAAVIGKIIKNPIGFLGNLVDGVKLGLKNFIANIGTHLKKGLMGWLFGALEGAGITLPQTFDLKGILSLVLQVLGLTYANIRARAVNILGEPMVRRLEQVAEIFKVLVTEGPAGLWRFIKEKVGDIKSMVLDGIMNFVRDRIIVAGITWIVSLLNPASAFIKACKAIYDIVMFFVNRGRQIMALVNAVLDSVAAIANGAIAGAAAAVESALAKAIPVAISFLASLLGLGGISQKIRSIIEKIQAPINRAIDWVITKAVSLVKTVGGMLGIGREDKAPKDVGKMGPEERKNAARANLEGKLARGLRGEQLPREMARVKQQYNLTDVRLSNASGEHPKILYIASPPTETVLAHAAPGQSDNAAAPTGGGHPILTSTSANNVTTPFGAVQARYGAHVLASQFKVTAATWPKPLRSVGTVSNPPGSAGRGSSAEVTDSGRVGVDAAWLLTSQKISYHGGHLVGYRFFRDASNSASNVAPQYSSFNSGAWSTFEAMVAATPVGSGSKEKRDKVARRLEVSVSYPRTDQTVTHEQLITCGAIDKDAPDKGSVTFPSRVPGTWTMKVTIQDAGYTLAGKTPGSSSRTARTATTEGEASKQKDLGLKQFVWYVQGHAGTTPPETVGGGGKTEEEITAHQGTPK